MEQSTPERQVGRRSQAGAERRGKVLHYVQLTATEELSFGLLFGRQELSQTSKRTPLNPLVGVFLHVFPDF